MVPWVNMINDQTPQPVAQDGSWWPVGQRLLQPECEGRQVWQSVQEGGGGAEALQVQGCEGGQVGQPGVVSVGEVFRAQVERPKR